jgi:hypothetical protein
MGRLPHRVLCDLRTSKPSLRNSTPKGSELISELLTYPVCAPEITGFSASGVRTNTCPVFLCHSANLVKPPRFWGDTSADPNLSALVSAPRPDIPALLCVRSSEFTTRGEPSSLTSEQRRPSALW